MGLLTAGAPLTWSETKKHARYIQEQGIKQFIYLYNKFSARVKRKLKFGDEIEYTLVRFDPHSGHAQLLLAASDLLEKLPHYEENGEPIIWQPEYAEYMIEGLPGCPFGQLLHSFTSIERSMRKRRLQLESHLPKGCCALTISVFPRLGCPDFTYPPCAPTPHEGPSRSLFFPTEAINQGHPRFITLTRNIRHRRGSKVVINPPIFHDINTPKPFLEDFSQLHNGTDPLATRDAKPDHVYLDAMGFGMGCSCLQITFQACCIDEARLLYDQLVTICPIVMALSAATPAIRGYLVDTDCRWGLISASVDDRTEEERGLKPLKENKFVLPKSRYDTVSSYLSPMGEAYNDIPLVYDPEFYEELISGGVDHLLAQHVAHLFTRDPISVFKERVLVPEGEEFVEHFENIQSTNWQSMRFKPPPLNSNIGWRVEFRPTELQLTDFENAAFVTFILLLSRTILRLKLNLLIPISKVDENMAAAMKRDAVRTGMFYFRQSHRLTTDGTPIQMTRACAKFGRKRTYSFGPDAVDGLESTEPTHKGETPHPTLKPFCLDNDIEVRPEESYTLMTISEIMNGSEDFPGLLPLVRHYVNASGGSDETVALVHRYLNLLECRASGHIMTTASWMRSRIMSHPLYAGDSRVTPEINTDLMRECRNITQGLDRPPELLPPLDGICIKPNARCRFGATCKKCNYNDEDFCCEDSTKTITVQENEDENNT